MNFGVGSLCLKQLVKELATFLTVMHNSFCSQSSVMIAYCMRNARGEYPPLSHRVIKCSSDQSVPGYGAPRPSIYKIYCDEQMSCAIKGVVESGMSIRPAALEYDIPRSTLGDHIQGRVLPGAVGGRQPYLTRREEKELVEFIIRSSEIGFLVAAKKLLHWFRVCVTVKA